MADGISTAVELRRGRRTSSVSIRRPEINVPDPHTRPASGRFCTVDAEIVDDAAVPNPLARRLVLLMIVVGFAAIATYAWINASAAPLT